MNKITRSKSELVDIIKLGLYMEEVLSIIEFAAYSGNMGLFESLENVVEECRQSLNDEENRKLNEIIHRRVNNKSKEMVVELRNDLSEQEIDELLAELDSQTSLT